jgi:hypothetical protein
MKIDTATSPKRCTLKLVITGGSLDDDCGNSDRKGSVSQKIAIIGRLGILEGASI